MLLQHLSLSYACCTRYCVSFAITFVITFYYTIHWYLLQFHKSNNNNKTNVQRNFSIAHTHIHTTEEKWRYGYGGSLFSIMTQIYFLVFKPLCNYISSPWLPIWPTWTSLNCGIFCWTFFGHSKKKHNLNFYCQNSWALV